MAASLAIHGLLVLLAWYELGLHSPSPRATEITMEFVHPQPLDGSRAAASPSPRRIAQINQESALPTHKAGLDDGGTEVSTDPLYPAEQVMEQNDVEEMVQGGRSSQLAEPAAASPNEAVRNFESLRLDLVQSRLEANKFYPASARRRGIEGEVELGFALNGEGLADAVMILAGSGHTILDRAAMQTVHRAQPFPIFEGEYRVRLRFSQL